MIASGKSTYARNAARAGFVVVNDDAIVNAVHGGEYSLYDEKLKPLYKSVENHIVSMAVALGRPILIDRGTNISLRARARWIALANALDVPCSAIEVRPEQVEAHARRRFEADARDHSYEYWLAAAESHWSRYATPSISEGFADVYHIDYEYVMSGEVIHAPAYAMTQLSLDYIDYD